MFSYRVIKKCLKFVLSKIDDWEIKNKFDIDFDDLRQIVNQSFDVLKNQGLKFNIILPVYKKIFVDYLGLLCFKLEKGENVESFDIILSLNDMNDDNEEFLELKKHKKILNSEIYRPILESMYNCDGIGQPPVDCVLNFNILYLQAKYNLSDNQVLKDIRDRESFKFFLDYPEKLPCSSTLENFRNRLINFVKIEEIWFKHQQQITLMNYPISEDLAIDASFLDANQGSYGKPRGIHALTSRSRDGTSTTKNDEHHFGFKYHGVMDLKFQLIRMFEVTTAKVHDSQVTFDFTLKFIMYADKGYFGADFSCLKGYMLRKSNNPKVNAHRTHRNWRISRKRGPVERIFAEFKEHGQNHTKLTTTPRNQVKMLFASLLYNVKQIITLEKEIPPKKKKKKNKEIDYKILFEFFQSIPKIVEQMKTIELMKKFKLKRIKYKRAKYLSQFKKPTRKKKIKSRPKTSQNPIKKKFNRKLAYSF